MPLLIVEKAELSVKWRRGKKTFRTFRSKNSKVRRRSYPYRYKIPKTYQRRKLKEPEPLIDIFEERSRIIIVAELAGFKKDNLKIHARDQKLTLAAENRDRKYYKSLNLPKRVIPNAMQTTYKNGVLEIRLKKAAEEKAIKKIAG
jgi:HSP20 family molecular chaperone IbpA